MQRENAAHAAPDAAANDSRESPLNRLLRKPASENSRRHAGERAGSSRCERPPERAAEHISECTAAGRS